jgi:prenyltransferase beta subunit
VDVKKVVLLVAGVVAFAFPARAGVVDDGTAFLLSRQQPDGGFAEPGGRSDPSLTAWVVLALTAGRREPRVSPAEYLAERPAQQAQDVALRVLALRALGGGAGPLIERLQGMRRPDGRIGPLVNSTIWGVLAFRAAGRPAGAATVRYLLRQQRPSGGWSWAPGGAPDSNDTAAAIQALRAAGVGGRPIRRALGFLRRSQNRDGGFSLVPGRASDAQSTAWALQAFAGAHAKPPKGARAFLLRMRRPDGSFRYSARYAVTPVWVTAQVLPALAGKPFPLR